MNAKDVEKIVRGVMNAQKKMGKTTKAKKVKADSDNNLSWWNKKFGFEVKQTGLKKQCSNGKTYPAVKGVTKDGRELTLVATRGEKVYKMPF